MSILGRPRIKQVSDCETGAQGLITAIWNHYGGPKKVALICGVKISDASNWEARGSVSLAYIERVVTKLKLEKVYFAYLAFNYIDVCLANPPQYRTPWKDVVKIICDELKFSDDIRKDILALQAPELPKLYKKVA